MPPQLQGARTSCAPSRPRATSSPVASGSSSAPTESSLMRCFRPRCSEHERRLSIWGSAPLSLVTSSHPAPRRSSAVDLGFGPPEPRDELAPGATAEDVRAAVAGRGETVIVVGHQPDCGQIAAALSGGPEPAFPPAGVHFLEL